VCTGYGISEPDCKLAFAKFSSVSASWQTDKSATTQLVFNFTLKQSNLYEIEAEISRYNVVLDVPRTLAWKIKPIILSLSRCIVGIDSIV